MHSTLTGSRGDQAVRVTEPATGPLAGRRIALNDIRKLDLFASLLESRGATIVRAPLFTTHDTLADDAFRQWLDAVCAGAMHDMIWTTAEGVKAAIRLAAALNRDWELVAALARVRHFASGTATARAMQSLGFLPDVAVAASGDAMLIPALRRFNLTRRTVGLQIHSPEANRELIDFVRWMRADLRLLSPYRAASSDDFRRLRSLLDSLLAGELDAIAFSDSSEARLLQSLARHRKQGHALTQRLESTRIVALSPRVADDLRRIGVAPHVVPPRSFHILPLAEEIVTALRS